MTAISDDHVKLHFRMEVDEDGWPPASVESLWAVDLGDGTVRLDNTPWFVRGVTSRDIIQVDVEEDGLRWAGSVDRAEGRRLSSQRSGHAELDGTPEGG